MVSISTFNFRELDCPAAEITHFSGRIFSHFGFRFFRVTEVDSEVGEGFKFFSGIFTSGILASESIILDNILKWLQVDNKGMFFTRCLVQNPPPVP